jgi:hypothetical protein
LGQGRTQTNVQNSRDPQRPVEETAWARRTISDCPSGEMTAGHSGQTNQFCFLVCWHVSGFERDRYA